MHAGEEASEEINALFGEGSAFHHAHGFYIDGVDEKTAMLPPDWRSREVRRPVASGDQTCFAVTPELHDLVVSKLCRLDAKDRAFIEELHAYRRLAPGTLLERLATVSVDPAVAHRAADFVRGLAP